MITYQTITSVVIIDTNGAGELLGVILPYSINSRMDKRSLTKRVVKCLAPRLPRPLFFIPPKPPPASLSLKPQTLAVWRTQKKYGLSYVRVGSRIRYRLADLEKFLESRTVNGVAADE